MGIIASQQGLQEIIHFFIGGECGDRAEPLQWFTGKAWRGNVERKTGGGFKPLQWFVQGGGNVGGCGRMSMDCKPLQWFLQKKVMIVIRENNVVGKPLQWFTVFFMSIFQLNCGNTIEIML